MKKILLIEDEESIRRLIRYDLRQKGFDVVSAKDGKEAMELFDVDTYDVIIVDWMLPKVSGIELVKHFRAHETQAILFMLTAKDEEGDILDAFEAGVDDYMSKPFSPRELIARLQAHLRRNQDQVSQDRVLKVDDLVIDLDRHAVLIENEEVFLTKKEYDLLVYLVTHLDIVLSRDQILNEIWNFDYDGDTRIVDVHIFKLRSKLEKASMVIESLRGVGYVAKKG